ncbi:MAG: condensation domain-containing protein, partial [Actinomycetota bacterium]|nr:condensation domain-containing protein [Actinomycetota bacterium]
MRPDDRVVLSFEARNWCDFAVAYAGVHQAGAVPVLVSLGPQHSQGSLGRIIAHCGASIVVGSAKLVPPTGLAGTLAWFGSVGELEDGHDGRQRSGPSSPGKPVELSYRSGPLRSLQVTRHGHGDILSDLVMVDAASPGLGGTPFLHAFPCGSEGARRALWIPLGPSPGAVVTLVSFAPDAFCALAAEHGAARWSLGPSAAGFILDSGVLDSGVLDGHDLSSLVHLVLLTGKASPALLARLGAALPRASVLSLARTVSAPGDAGERRRGESGQNRRVHAPVAFSQEGMLWHEQFVPGSQNLPPLVRRYHGPLDVEVLERALIEIVRRHEPLRTTFEMQAGRLVQIVSPVDLRLVRHDLGSSAHAQEAEVAMLLGDLRWPFDLVEGPLFEAHLVRLGPRDHLVAFRVHHSVYDDWSVSVFRRELSALYAAFLAGRPSPLEDLPLSFGDLSRAQHRRMEGPAGAVELSWWKDELAGAPLCLQLPIDDPDRPQGAPQASAEPVSLELPPELATQLRALARRERTTLFMTMTAAFQALLQRWTGQEELLLATVVANRNRRELEQMVGCFTKKVLVRLSGVGDPTFVELLPRVRTALLGALAHQDLPFETVLQRSLSSAAAVHGLVPHPVVMLQGVTPQTDDLVLPGLTTSGYQTSATTTRTHFSAGDDDRSDTGATPWGAGLYLGTFLILSVIEEGAGVSLSARGAFHGPSVKRLLATFETLLADIVAHPERRMSELRLLDDRLLDDRHQAELVGRGADIDAQVPGDRAHEIFQAQASRTPSRLAVHDGGQSLTYEQLASRAQVLADRLRRLGVGRGDLVGLCMATSTDAVVAVLAIWKAGAGYVALDAEDTDARHRQIIVRASLGVVVTQGRLGPSELEGLATVVVDDDGPSRAPLVTDPEAGVDADVALVFYGSGPSAVPHGVVIEHGGVVNLLAGLRGHVLRPSSEPTPLVGLRVCLSARPTDDAFLRQLVPVLDGHTLQVVPGDAGGGVAALVALIGSGDVD